jgi:hypothetical protein
VAIDKEIDEKTTSKLLIGQLLADALASEKKIDVDVIIQYQKRS